MRKQKTQGGTHQGSRAGRLQEDGRTAVAMSLAPEEMIQTHNLLKSADSGV